MFDAAEYDRRLGLIRAEMAERGVDLLLIDHAEFLAWATGYTVSETMYRAALIPASGAAWFTLRALDAEPCRQASWIRDIVGFADTTDPHAAVAGTIRAHGFGAARIGLDFTSYGCSAHTLARLRAELPQATRAARIADSAMAEVAYMARLGVSPRDAAVAAAATFLRLGADSGETGPILRAAGNNEFLHGRMGDDALSRGDILHVELIPKVGNYGARLMRPIVIGGASAAQAHVAERLVALQDRQIAAMRPGATAAEVDAILRQAVLAEGLRPDYDNVTGYALGLYARTPRTSDFSYCFLPNADWRLEAGMVFHMYASAQGLGFSETVVVEAAGGRRLTQAPRRLLHSL
jgi:Xaa-Pro dipeptidase